jgi:dolichol-phosphate mannosyltransferase
MLSIVIPVFNEEESLSALHAELIAVARDEGYDLDILFVDDGSTDGSWPEIERLSETDSQVRGIRLRRNFGKAAALSAGFAAARGEIVFTLDADLQDDPQEIPNFLKMLQPGSEAEELDVVSGWKQVRHDPWHKVGPSRLFNWLVGFLTGVGLHDHNCGFKCYRREIFDEVRLYGELHRFVPVLAAARGWRVGEMVVNHRPRQFGHSKYGVRRFIKGFLDLLTVYFLTGFGRRPAHLLGTLGLIGFVAGGLGVVVLSVFWVVSRLDEVATNDLHLHERAIFYYSMGALLLGGQFLSIGFLAEMITAFYGRDSEPYSIRQTAGAVTSSGPPEPSAAIPTADADGTVTE